MNAVEPRLARITVYPVKSLDGVEVDEARVVENGGLEFDRTFALFDENGDYVNGKRERAVHRIESTVDLDERLLTLSTDSDGPADGTFSLPEDDADVSALTDWFSAYFGYPVDLRRETAGGFPDDTTASGPTVVSTATLREVASWFPGIDVGGIRRRLRANLEIDGVPAFWEDRLFADRDQVVGFALGGVEFEGVNPCQRCVVPSRDPDTGEEYDGFRERFIERRRETMPPWSGGEWFDHHFRLMLNTRVPEGSWGEFVAVGDRVQTSDTRPRD